MKILRHLKQSVGALILTAGLLASVLMPYPVDALTVDQPPAAEQTTASGLSASPIDPNIPSLLANQVTVPTPVTSMQPDQTRVIVRYKKNRNGENVKQRIKKRLKLRKLDSWKHPQRNLMKSLRGSAPSLAAPQATETQAALDVLEVTKGDNVNTIVDALKKDPDVEYAQPNYKLVLQSTPTDPRFQEQWGLGNIAQSVEGLTGRAKVDVNASKAWDLTKGSATVLVGVLDTGMDINHIDLKDSIYTNPDSKADDPHGCNFTDLKNKSQIFNNSVQDLHGTEVAGIIAASANTTGITGVAPGVKILPLKFINGNWGYTSDAIDAIQYAMQKGVKIINCSFGGSDNNQALKETMANSGILFVCSGGNRGLDVAASPVYPACFDLPNVLSVGSIDSMGVLTKSSSFGNKIAVAAPGNNLLTTTPNGNYDYFSGTSASAPMVTGIAALIQSKEPGLSAVAIANRIKSSVVKTTALSGKIGTGGRVDAYAALTNTIPATDSYSGPGNDLGTIAASLEGGNIDTWYTLDQLSKIKEKIHYGESGVNPASGNYSISATDMTAPAPGFQINISRTYNSRDDLAGLLGHSWTFGFEGRISGMGTGLLETKLPSGSTERFRLINGLYVAEDSRSQLQQAGAEYVLTTKDQYKYTFSAAGFLRRMEDRNGNAVDITLDGTGKITKITDAVSRVYTVNYNGSGRIDNITDPENRVIRYTYDADYNLIKVTDATGGTMNYSYDAAGCLSEVKDHYGKSIIKIIYNHADGDNQNKVAQTTSALGDIENYTYDLPARKTTATSSGSRVTTYWFDKEQYTTQIQDPDGRISQTEYYIVGGKNKYGDILREMDRNGRYTTRDINPNNGNVLKITNPDGSFKSWTYDDLNNVTSETDENGVTTYSVYDAAKKLLLKKLLPLNGKTVYTPGGDETAFAVTSYTYYTPAEAATNGGTTAKALLKSVIDPTGAETVYTYDKYGNTATEKDPVGKTTTSVYNNVGQKTKVTTHSGNTTDVVYDGNGQAVKVTLKNGATNRVLYDLDGRTVQEISPKLYDSAKDNVAAGTYADAAVGTRYTYVEGTGQVKTMVDALGNTTTYTYDNFGNKATETKANDSSYSYEYDSLDRLSKVYFQICAGATKTLLTDYTYSVTEDKKSQKTETKYLNSTDKAVTIWLSDYKDRLIQTQYPDGTSEKTVYNPNGTVFQTIGRNGAITQYNYDSAGRVTAVWSPIEVGNGKVLYSCVQSTYDKAGRKLTEQKGRDKVELGKFPVTSTSQSFEYLKNGDLIRTTDSEGRKSEFAYDRDGNKASETVYTDAVNKQITEYTYNQNKKVLTIKQHVQAGDLYGSPVGATTDTVLSVTNTYDLNDNLITATNPKGVTTTYAYDALNREISTSEPGTDEKGTATTLTTATVYNWEGKVVSKTDQGGNFTQFAYTPKGEVVGVTDAKGGITSFEYDQAGRKTVEVSPKNYEKDKALTAMSRIQYTYDLMDRLTVKTDVYKEPSTGQFNQVTTKTYTFDADGNQVSETDAVGNTTLTTYNLADKPVSTLDAVNAKRQLPFAKKAEYDSLGRKSAEINSTGARTQYTYDDQDNVVKITLKKSDSAPEVVLQTATYDKAGRKLTETDGNGATTTYTYNNLNKPRTIVTPGSASIPSQITTFQYDANSNLAWSQDGSGKTAWFTYNNQNLMTAYKEAKGDGSDAITKATAYDKMGNKRFETDARGTVTVNTYDALNRLVQTKKTVKGVDKYTKYTYDANNNQTTVTDWLGNVTSCTYDPMNRVISKTDATGVVVQRLNYTPNSLQSSSTDALGNVTQFSYDEDNRLIKTTDPEGHVTQQSFDSEGNTSSKMDGRGTVVTYSYDEQNRLTEVRNAKGEVTSFTYDTAGNKLTQTDAAGHVTTFEYAPQNKVTRKIDHGGRVGITGAYTYLQDKTETYTYNADGSLKTKTDRNGKITQYTYDLHGRLIKKAIGSVSVGYTYDTGSNVLTMTDATGTTTRTYDEDNRVLTKAVPQIGTSTYTYDTKEATAGTYSETTTDPKGNVTKKVYDKVGRLIQVTESGTTTTYTYRNDGKRASVVYPSGAKEVYTYYTDGLVKTLTNLKASGTTIDAYSYTYDAAHNQTSKTDGRGVTKYEYDVLNRLAKVTEPARNGQPERVTTYLFDAAGNRQMQMILQGATGSSTSYTYNEQNRLIQTVEQTGPVAVTVTYDYDNNGNVMSKVKETLKSGGATGLGAIFADPFKAGSSPNSDVAFYTYDVWNNLASSIEGDKTAKYAYNGDGYRTEKNVNGAVTRYLYEADKVVLETDGAGNQVARNVYGTNLLTRKVSGLNLYYMYNAHGDVTALIDSAGTTKGTYYYDAFGNVVEDTSNGLNNPILYAGYQYDKESGLYYLNARSYDPVTARFMQEDTYAGDPNDPLSLNLYAYCHNEPVMYDDPTGHMEIFKNSSSTNNSNKKRNNKLDLFKLDKAVDKGITEGVKQSLKDTKNFIQHPIKTLTPLGNAFSDVGKVVMGDKEANARLNNIDKQVKQGLKTNVKNFKKKDIYEKAETIGYVAGYSATSAVTAKVSAKGLKVVTNKKVVAVEGGSNVLGNANFAQKTFSNTFSPEGIKKYSELAGQPIKTIDDLAAALKSGKVSPSDLPVEYIVRDGNTLILNTRTSQALTQAGIPRSQWGTINQTGNEFFEDLLTGQLSRNGLTSAGTPTVRPSGGTK